MNNEERETLSGLNVHIKYIRETLVRLEGKIDEVEQQTTNLLAWRGKVIGISIGTSTGIAMIISIISLILKFTK